jgi:hypothetical protein
VSRALGWSLLVGAPLALVGAFWFFYGGQGLVVSLVILVVYIQVLDTRR